MMPHQQNIFCRGASKNKLNEFTSTYRGISFRPSSNNISSSPPYWVGIKRKLVPQEKSNEELPAVIRYDSYYYPLVIDDDLKWVT